MDSFCCVLDDETTARESAFIMSGRRGQAGGIHSQASSMPEWLSNGFKEKNPIQTRTTTPATSLLAPCSAEQHVRCHHQDRVLASKCHQVQKDGISGPAALKAPS